MSSYTLSNLSRRYRRTGLTAMGVALAIALIVIMFSLGEGIRLGGREFLDDEGADIYVFGEGSESMLQTTSISNVIEIAEGIVEQSDGSVEGAYPVLTSSNIYAVNRTAIDGQDGAENETVFRWIKGSNTVANGEVPGMYTGFDALRYEFIEGGWLPTGGDPHYNDGGYDGQLTGEIAINEILADYLDVGVGDQVYLNVGLPERPERTDEWLADCQGFNVTGIYRPTIGFQSTNGASIHLSELQDLVGKEGKGDQILVSLADDADDAEVAQWISDNFEAEAFTTDELFQEFEDIVGTFEGIADMVAIVTITVSVLFVATIMAMTVKERKGEIGLLRAIGFSKWTITKNMVLESMAISLLGFCIGVVLGYAGTVWLDGVLHGYLAVPEGFRFTVITPLLIIRATLFAVCIGLLSSLFPVYYSTHLNIAQTMRDE